MMALIFSLSCRLKASESHLWLFFLPQPIHPIDRWIWFLLPPKFIHPAISFFLFPSSFVAGLHASRMPHFNQFAKGGGKEKKKHLNLIKTKANFHSQEIQGIVEQAKWQEEADKLECGTVHSTSNLICLTSQREGTVERALKDIMTKCNVWSYFGSWFK